MKFTKMHGCGNDYVYVNGFETEVKDPKKTSIIVSDRHCGIGSDGLIIIKPSDKATCFMDMYNADGSRGMMCGNGIRCVAKYVYDNKIAPGTEFDIDTLSGIKHIHVNEENGLAKTVKVDMGEAILDPKLIPVNLEGDNVIDREITVEGKKYKITAVSMGNPHAVTFVDDVEDLELEKIGPGFEKNELFPESVNTEFVRVEDRNSVTMRVWERGSGETFACGTGACAVVVACVLNNLTDSKVTVHLRGGDLFIEYDRETGKVFMTGEAVTVFEGYIEL